MVQEEIDADPDSRRAKLQRIINIRGTTKKSLAEIVEALTGSRPRAEEMVMVGQARFQTMTHTLHMPRDGGGDPVPWELCDPNLLLARLVAESPVLQNWFQSALQQRPCSAEQPWRLLVGFDEFVPGNKLRVDNSRKCMNLSFSFVELGSALSCDLAWFTPVSVRKTVMQQVDGGWSCMLKEYLKLHLLSPGGLESAAGVALDLGGGKVAVLHAKVHQILSDGDGLRIAMDWMGHASTKPCWKHYNVFRKGSRLVDATDPDEEGVDITCADPLLFKAWPESEFRVAIDVVVEAHEKHVRGETTKANIDAVRRGLGFKATKKSLLADIPLRGCFESQEVLRYDWVHTFLAHGIVTGEAWHLIAACEEHGLASQKDIHDFLKEEWLTPQHRRGAG
jgi:hypothetical protein